MSNHIHLVVQQKDGKLSDCLRNFKKFTSKKLFQTNRIDWNGLLVNMIQSQLKIGWDIGV